MTTDPLRPPDWTPDEYAERVQRDAQADRDWETQRHREERYAPAPGPVFCGRELAGGLRCTRYFGHFPDACSAGALEDGRAA